MFELKNIKKIYNVGDVETKALDDISVAFREKEFVAILGTSGSGKTTALNIIGGLDRYDSGDLVIKGKSTKNFTDKDWDAYRNNSVGFVFQSYNLITHLSIVANVELGMTLSGVSKSEKRKRAIDVLKKVGLKDHLHKKPNQLSGGQMQRVAIARALANDPEILLCDEPTGALDSTTSVQILDLIKEVAKDKLVIMVTHNPELAEQYADRIIKFEDGKIISDSHTHIERPKKDEFKLTKTNMTFFTALGLSFNNLKTKKGRTFLTAFASSIGIIGIALILSLSTGFQKQIDKFQADAMNEFPIQIFQSTTTANIENIEGYQEGAMNQMMGTPEYADSDEVFLFDSTELFVSHTNKFDDEFINYLNNIDPNICSKIGNLNLASMNLLREIDGSVKPVSLKSPDSISMEFSTMSSYPKNLGNKKESYLTENYDLVAGSYPESPTDLILLVDTKNRIDLHTLKALGFDVEGKETVSFEEIIGTEFVSVANDEYYAKTEFGSFIPDTNYDEMFLSEDNINLKITGIVRAKKDVKIGLLATGIVYDDELSTMVLENTLDSEIIKAQKDSMKNVFTMTDMTEEEKSMTLAGLGGESTPFAIMVYPKDFESKDKVTAYLDEYNKGKEDVDKIIYMDLASSISDMTGGIMDAITLVLIAFAGISLVVSLIM
ncbi:MAG TPA: ABC transporter ATP-binding protein, partial [Clostridiales bacterium]|nr:ABC transporter ATP-binding protein [Clostridiales bacterium]